MSGPPIPARKDPTYAHRHAAWRTGENEGRTGPPHPLGPRVVRAVRGHATTPGGNPGRGVRPAVRRPIVWTLSLRRSDGDGRGLPRPATGRRAPAAGTDRGRPGQLGTVVRAARRAAGLR